MEEIIFKISQEVINELKKSKKAPYPLYYKNVFNSVAQKNGILEDLNPKLLCIDPGINEMFLQKTTQTIKEVSHVSKALKEDSQNLVEEVMPFQSEEFKEIVLSFSSKMLEKINLMENTIQNLESELDKAYKELLIDPLTKVYNRKALNKDLNEILDKGKNKKLDLVVAIIDLDHFKEINDKFGHLVGDFVLIKVANIMKKMTRVENKIYRYGGDEFVIIFNRMQLEQVELIVKRLIKKIEKTLLKYKDEIINVTISAGLAEHHKKDSIDTIIKRADMALYKAKVNRNGLYILKD